MQALWGRLYSTSSSVDRGMMFQLKNWINRTSVPSDPQNNMTAAEDFMLLLLHAHVVAAASTMMLRTWHR